MSNPWIRLYRDSLHNPKIVSLNDRQHRAWVNCLLMAGRDGVLPKISAICCHLRHDSERQTLELIQELVAAKLIDKSSDGRFQVHDWDWHQHDGRPPASEWATIRQRIFARDNYTCQYCGERGGQLQCDHVHPVAHGGGHDDENLVTACLSCNRAKRSKLVSIEEWRAIRGAQR